MNVDPLAVPDAPALRADGPPEYLPVEEIARLSAAILDAVATVVVGMTRSRRGRAGEHPGRRACALRGRARARQDTGGAQPRIGSGP